MSDKPSNPAAREKETNARSTREADAPSGRTYVTSAPETLKPDYTRTELNLLSRTELVNIILKLQTRVPKLETGHIAVDPVKTLKFDEGKKAERYVRLPAGQTGKIHGKDKHAWRITLHFSDSRYPPVGVELVSEIVLGRVTRATTPDLDLTLYGGTILGVSRQHASFHPSRTHLYIKDLSSTNGTYRDGVRISPGQTEKIASGDTISLGQLHFKLQIDERPSIALPKE